MARAVTLQDPVFIPKPNRNAFERFWLSLICDERDLPFIWLSLQMTLTILPAAALVFAFPEYAVYAAVPYWGLVFLGFLDRYMLMLHNTSHRRLFKRKYNPLNKWISWVLAIFCGQTPNTYFIHHLTMHHAEGNLPKDLSSTMKYQRDSAFDFARYFLRFFFLILFDMTRYQLRKKRMKLVRQMLAGELSFIALCVGLAVFYDWRPTLVVFIVPFVLIRFLMMAGNWGQHAFVDPDEPANDFKSAITCINGRYNRRAFNDGYHISHHLQANRHWTEHPGELESNLEDYVANDAIIFEKIDFFIVWVFLMLKRYDLLAKHFVELRDEPRSQDELIALFKRRLARFPKERLDALAR